jgi:hypothetical protein
MEVHGPIAQEGSGQCGRALEQQGIRLVGRSGPPDWLLLDQRGEKGWADQAGLVAWLSAQSLSKE